MTNWSDGYVSDINYTFGYYAELNPIRFRLALISKGIPCPKITNACELGFGQGVSINMHAAASSTNWWGTDFNSAQVSFARDLADKSCSEPKLYDESFEEFCSRKDLPDFDFIAMHGIWSWISEDNREIIGDFIRRKLKTGGILYCSYNTFPGHSSFSPLRKLMTYYSESAVAQGECTETKIRESVGYIDQLIATEPFYLASNPQLKQKIAALKKQPVQYLAHEYFNKDWNPAHFFEIEAELQNFKLQFGCSAKYKNHIDTLNFSEGQQTLLSNITNPTLKETTKDFILNTQFRQDYWMKGKRTMSTGEQIEQLKKEVFILVVPIDKVSMTFTCPRGNANLNESVYEVFLDNFKDHKPRSIEEVLVSAEKANISLSQIVECVATLLDRGEIYPVSNKAPNDVTIDRCKALNREIIHLSHSSTDHGFLVSPIIGGGLNVTRIEQLFIDAYLNGINTSKTMADYTWQILDKNNHKVVKNGKTLQKKEDNLLELFRLAEVFHNQRLTIFNSLMIVT